MITLYTQLLCLAFKGKSAPETHRFIAPVLQHIQLPLDHRLQRDSVNTSFKHTHLQSSHQLFSIYINYSVKKNNTRTDAELTSSMLGMMSRSHSLRKESLSKEGSTLRISVRTSDISVLENSPPEQHITEAQRSFQGEAELFSTRSNNTRKQSEPVQQKIYKTSPRGGRFWLSNVHILTQSLVHRQSLTYEVSHLVRDSTRSSDEGVIALIILHLHLKEPCEAETGDVFAALRVCSCMEPRGGSQTAGVLLF